MEVACKLPVGFAQELGWAGAEDSYHRVEESSSSVMDKAEPP